MNTIASDKSYEVLLKRIQRGELRAPQLTPENREKVPTVQAVVVRPAYFDAAELSPEKVIR